MGHELIERARMMHRERFGNESHVVAIAPGRVELLGNHTDYNQGLVMALAVDRYIAVAAARRSDQTVRLYSDAFNACTEFTVEQIEKNPDAAWADYTKGLLHELIQRGFQPGGFEAVVASNIPLGAGLSSSAALLVSSALAVRGLYPYRVVSWERVEPAQSPELSSDDEKMLLARICQAAENRFVGVNCGLLDHISSLYGRANQAILIDCLTLKVDWTPLPENMAVVVAHSGVRHSLVAGEYNERRAACEQTAKMLGVPSLRFATIDMLEQARDRIGKKNYRYALHVVGENERVKKATTLLREGKFREFGKLLFESHKSSQENFRNSCAELDLLVELAAAHPACFGSRLTGGGFGGATLSLVEADKVDEFLRHLTHGYKARTGNDLEAWTCRVVNGAELIH